jgi:hypothetical protein
MKLTTSPVAITIIFGILSDCTLFQPPKKNIASDLKFQIRNKLENEFQSHIVLFRNHLKLYFYSCTSY